MDGQQVVHNFKERLNMQVLDHKVPDLTINVDRIAGIGAPRISESCPGR